MSLCCASKSGTRKLGKWVSSPSPAQTGAQSTPTQSSITRTRRPNPVRVLAALRSNGGRASVRPLCFTEGAIMAKFAKIRMKVSIAGKLPSGAEFGYQPEQVVLVETELAEAWIRVGQ